MTNSTESGRHIQSENGRMAEDVKGGGEAVKPEFQLCRGGKVQSEAEKKKKKREWCRH